MLIPGREREGRKGREAWKTVAYFVGGGFEKKKLAEFAKFKVVGNRWLWPGRALDGVKPIYLGFQL